jgi:hypothetical protein
VVRRLTRRLVAGAGAVVLLSVGAPAGAQAQDITGLPSWEVVAVPAVAEFTNRLAGVYAASPDAAWAVGSALGRAAGGGQEHRTLLQRWDGRSWSQVTPPALPGGRVAQLGAVDGTGPDDVWAVGAATAPNANTVTGQRTAALHWNGRDWTAVPSPNRGFLDDNNRLLGVAAVASDDVWAVGELDGSLSGGGRASILLHFDGTSWRAVDHPCGVGLRAVSASSADDVWAVGAGTTCHFDGSSWTPARPAAPVAGRRLDLSGVAVLGPTEAWAVGRTVYGCGERVCTIGEVQRWNGAGWTTFATPGVDVRGVHAVAPDDVWAISLNDGLLHFDGTGWAHVPAPRGVLEDIAASRPDDLWAVGATSGGSPSVAQIQHAASAGTATVVGGVGHAGAVISWTGPSSGSVPARNSFGDYEIVALPVGTYDFIVTAAGCAPQIRRVTVTAGRIIRQDFTLSC